MNMDSTNISEFSTRLKLAREKTGISQTKLSKMIGCSRSYIFQLEKGNNFPSLNAIIAIAKCLNVSIDYLLIGRPMSEDKLDLELKKLLPDERKTLADNLHNLIKKLPDDYT